MRGGRRGRQEGGGEGGRRGETGEGRGHTTSHLLQTEVIVERKLLREVLFVRDFFPFVVVYPLKVLVGLCEPRTILRVK